jgi:ABC-type multidrug transport system fused ATPase/permease subunit
VLVDRGRIIAKGTHDELVDESPPYRELVDVWKRGLA